MNSHASSGPILSTSLHCYICIVQNFPWFRLSNITWFHFSSYSYTSALQSEHIRANLGHLFPKMLFKILNAHVTWRLLLANECLQVWAKTCAYNVTKVPHMEIQEHFQHWSSWIYLQFTKTMLLSLTLTAPVVLGPVQHMDSCSPQSLLPVSHIGCTAQFPLPHAAWTRQTYWRWTVE